MPYKDPAKTKAMRKRLKGNPKWMKKHRAYMRQYMKTWRVSKPGRIEYERKWQARFRKTHRRKYLKRLRDWQKRNRPKLRAHNRRWWKKHGKEWYQRTRKQRRAQSRKGYRRERRVNLEQQKARRNRSYWKNRERINAATREKRKKNPEKYRASERSRYRRRRIARIISQRNIQARRAGAIGTITPQEWLHCLRKHAFRCFYCRTQLTPQNRTLDHKIPLSRGGKNVISNTVPCCRLCNSRKHTLTTRQFRRRFTREVLN